MMNVHLELLTYLFVSVLGDLHYVIPIPFWLKVDILRYLICFYPPTTNPILGYLSSIRISIEFHPARIVSLARICPIPYASGLSIRSIRHFSIRLASFPIHRCDGTFINIILEYTIHTLRFIIVASSTAFPFPHVSPIVLHVYASLTHDFYINLSVCFTMLLYIRYDGLNMYFPSNPLDDFDFSFVNQRSATPKSGVQILHQWRGVKCP